MATELHDGLCEILKRAKVSQTTRRRSGITLCIEIFFMACRKNFLFFTMNSANEIFRFRLLNWVWFSVLLSNPFARRFSAGPQQFRILLFGVQLLFAMHVNDTPTEETSSNTDLRFFCPRVGRMDFCLLV